MKRNEASPSDRVSVAATALGLGIFAFLLRLFPLAQQSLNVDEGVIWATCRLPMVEQVPTWTLALRLVWLNEVHPPLYFLLESLWMRLGQSELLLRLPSMICGALLVTLGYLWFRRFASHHTSTLAALLMAVSSFQIMYSREARMYPLASLLCLASLYCFTRLVEMDGESSKEGKAAVKGGWVAAYLLCSVLALYTHYYAGLVLLAQAAYLAWSAWGNARNGLSSPHPPGCWLLRLGLIGLGFLPWLALQYTMTGNLFHPAGAQNLGLRFRPGPLNLFLLFFDLGAGDTLTYVRYMALTTALLILAACIWSLISAPPKSRALPGLVLFLPPLAAFILSTATPLRIFEYKYFMVTSPALWLLLGIFITRVSWRMLGNTALIFLLLVNLVSAANYAYNPDFANPDWREVGVRLARHSSPADLVLVQPSMALPALGYYYRGPGRILPIDQRPAGWEMTGIPDTALLWFCYNPTHPVEKKIMMAEWLSQRYPEVALYQPVRYQLHTRLRLAVYRVGSRERLPDPPLTENATPRRWSHY